MRVDRFRSVIKLQLQSMIAHNLLVFRFQEVKSILSKLHTSEIFRVSSGDDVIHRENRKSYI
jgi:hypothetical protein